RFAQHVGNRCESLRPASDPRRIRLVNVDWLRNPFRVVQPLHRLIVVGLGWNDSGTGLAPTVIWNRIMCRASLLKNQDGGPIRRAFKALNRAEIVDLENPEMAAVA